MKGFLNSKGSALPTVVIITVVLMILGIAILNVSLANTKHAVHQEKVTQAHYIAKSGIHITEKKIMKIFSINKPTNIGELMNHLSLLPTTGTITGVGTFDVTYDDSMDYLDVLKISSVGTHVDLNTKNTVTLSLKISFPHPTESNPSSWMSGRNFLHSTNPTSHSYIGQIVKVNPHNNNNIQSPQQPSGTPVYQASGIYLGKAINGISLEKANNSCQVTFDAEILYFDGIITDNDTTDDAIYFTISDAVVNDNLLSAYNSGFENYDRYSEYAGPYNGYADGFITYEVKSDSHYPIFGGGTRYGLVRFSQNVYNDIGTVIIQPGYYFFPNNFHVLADDAESNLVRIDDNDAIIPALENLFNATVKPASYIWGKN